MPSLDGDNIVIGRVLEGLGTVAAVAAVPTFTPGERLQALNRVASLIGDDRAAKARRPCMFTNPTLCALVHARARRRTA